MPSTPRYVILRKSGVHRAACFALYRALLRQKRELQLNEHQQHLFRNQIWAVFKRNTKIQSPPQISIALQLGYETLEGLQDGTRQQRLLDHIFELASAPKSSTPPSSTQAKPVQADKAPKIQSAPYPGAPRILDRPYQNLSGRRHVPVLVNANRVPFLRIKKPQPPFLSRIIRNIVKTRNRRILNGERLANELRFAQDEEVWDHILYELAGLGSRNLLEPRWLHEVQQAIDDNRRLRTRAIQKRADVSAKMHAIVEEERALAQEQKLRIRDEKHKAYKARRLATKGPGDSEIQKGLDSKMEETVILDAPTMTEAVLDQDQQDVRPPYTEEGMRKRSDKFNTPDELKQLYEGSSRPKTDEEIAKIEDARARRKEESERKAQKLKQKQEKTAYMEQRVNEEVEGPTNMQVGPQGAEGLDEALGFLKPPVDLAARRMDIQLQPEVLPLQEEPQSEWSARRRVDRRGDLHLDVLCQRLFQTSFRGIQRSGQF